MSTLLNPECMKSILSSDLHQMAKKSHFSMSFSPGENNNIFGKPNGIDEEAQLCPSCATTGACDSIF
jgi:hypothetical protein